MYCTCCSITLHSKLYMFSLFICIIVNIVFILFYLQVEPVFLPACLNKAIQITSVSSIFEVIQVKRRQNVVLTIFTQTKF